MSVVIYHFWWICWLWTAMTATWLKQEPASKEKPFASILYTAVVRGKVALPCDISSPSADDSAALILWYKDDSAQPIYTLDARRGSVDHAHQSSIPELESRAYFNMINRPAFLQLDPVKEDDAGEYRCRVDFHKARTVNTVITLKVIVPPREPIIVDENRQQLKGLVGPFNEGQPLSLTCSVVGGKPRPSLTWWQDYTLLDDNYTFISDEVVVNKIVIPEIERDDLRTVLTCQASNNNITIPASTTITLKLNLKPLEVDITPARRPMSANKKIELTCVSHGSRPPATITWWKESQQIMPSVESVKTEGETAISTLTYMPSVEDNGKYLGCRAENPRIPGSAIEKGWNVEIQYTPNVSLRVVSGAEDGMVKEGDDVTFECDIQAHPWVHEINWHFNGRQLVNDPSLGIMISSQTLVLRNVSRRMRGRFSCSAANVEGLGISDDMFLKVKYSPVCQPFQKSVYGVLNQESIDVECQLDADPRDIKFFWRFNSSTKVTNTILHKIHSEFQSIASYRIQTSEDYGTLMCWGENSIGVQREPCVFKIIPAEAPEPVQNCTVFNRTEELILVECLEGFNGGLEQTFIMEVYTKESGTLYAKVSSHVPIFLVNGLTPGTFFILLVYAVNRCGRSSVVRISTSTVRQAEKLTRNRGGVYVFNPVLTVFISATVALVFFIVILVIVIKVKKRSDLKAQQESNTKNKLDVPLQKHAEDENEEGPDIIPAKNLNRRFLICYDHDSDETCLQLHATPSSTQSYCTAGKVLVRSHSPDQGVMLFPESTYRSPTQKTDTIALQKLSSPRPKDQRQRNAIAPGTSRHAVIEDNKLDPSSQDHQVGVTDVSTKTAKSVLIKKQESAV
ncbi:hemicentin-1-like isoform X1 [Limulus polyphemus]|uniref:Hemicentin-1-like isoform X1 n=1 Tax=Limulus polyphemus TaxID=6850 RepID=A0ABM1TK34_LIMPO|nr:hemicentin-1-like isoform X1 [Limulus polyphemus]